MTKPAYIAARDLLEIEALPYQPNDKPRDMAFRHEILHTRRQKQRLIDIPGAKILAHSPRLNQTRSELNSDYADRLLGVSLAVARAAATCSELPLYQYLGGPGATRLPVPHMNILNGGIHAHWQGADFQEFMIAPYGADSFGQALEWGSQIYHTLQALLEKKGLSVGVGDEGGFAPRVSSNEEPFELIIQAIHSAGLKPGQDVGIACDPASSEFYENGQYHLRSEDRKLDSAAMAAYYTKLVDSYPLVLLEDGMAQDDWSGWKRLNHALGDRIELVGDDVFCKLSPAVLRRTSPMPCLSNSIRSAP